MSFVSYAQNFEDVMLRRVFHDVEAGFYVDVGAWEPEFDSVTKALYDAGWHGINIEPGPVFPKLAAARPRDINLPMALGAKAGRIALHVHHVDNTVLGTSTLQVQPPPQVAGAGMRVEEIEVEVRTLAQVLDEHAAEQHIHVLKIDAEGSELDILQGADWQRHRPELLVIEATHPRSQERNDEAWAPLLTAAGYHAVWFDGLNAWFLRTESMIRASAFRTPPNVFDDFRVYDHETVQRLTQAEAWGLSLEKAVLGAQDELHSEREAAAATAERLAQSEARRLSLEEVVLRAQDEQRDEREAAAATAERLAQSEARRLSLEEVVLRAQDELRHEREAAATMAERYVPLEERYASLARAYEDLLAQRRTLLEAHWRLVHRLEMPDGPRLLRLVLPGLRIIRRLMRRGRGLDDLPPNLGQSTALPVALPTAVPRASGEPLARSVETALLTLALRDGLPRS